MVPDHQWPQGLPARLLDGLLDDAAWVDTRGADPAAVLAEHDRLRTSNAPLVHSLMITDRDAASLDRMVEHDRLPVTVINTSGAGGLTSLAERSFSRLQVVAVDSPLRDPGDLVGNLLRVAAAARALDPEIVVRVQIPSGFGADDAIAAAEAEGLQGHLDCTDLDHLVDRLSDHIEADLSFAADLASSGATALQLFCAIDALIDGAELSEASALLQDRDHQRLRELITSFDEARIGRIRRRLTALRSPAVGTVLEQLAI